MRYGTYNDDEGEPEPVEWPYDVCWSWPVECESTAL